MDKFRLWDASGLEEDILKDFLGTDAEMHTWADNSITVGDNDIAEYYVVPKDMDIKGTAVEWQNLIGHIYVEGKYDEHSIYCNMLNE